MAVSRPKTRRRGLLVTAHHVVANLRVIGKRFGPYRPPPRPNSEARLLCCVRCSDRSAVRHVRVDLGTMSLLQARRATSGHLHHTSMPPALLVVAPLRRQLVASDRHPATAPIHRIRNGPRPIMEPHDPAP